MAEAQGSRIENRALRSSIIYFYFLSSIFAVAVAALPNSAHAAAAYGNASITAPGPNQKKVVLKNLGMSCVFCKAAVTAKLKQLPGVIAYDVDLKSDSATVLYDPAKVTIERLKQAIAEAGFQVRAVEEIER